MWEYLCLNITVIYSDVSRGFLHLVAVDGFAEVLEEMRPL